METASSISMVVGYHEYTPVPALAAEKHLRNRFAVIFDPYVDFDAALFFDVLDAISKVIDHDTVLVNVDDNIECQSIDDLRRRLLSIPEDDPEGDRLPPRGIVFRKRGEVTCVEETEFWANCGGPAPYHDSYTTAFYTREDLAGLFEAACVAACERAAVSVNEVFRGAPDPVHIPLHKRILTWMTPGRL